jgi:hypothetical protein
MAVQDSNIESYFSIYNLDGALSNARKKDYRELISSIYPGLIITVDYDKSVRFILVSSGLSAISSGALKGVAFLTISPEKKGIFVHNLENAGSLPPGIYLKSIEGNWYLIYQRTD